MTMRYRVQYIIPLASQGVLRFLIAVIGSNSQIYANKPHLPEMTEAI
jgi:hypothetical protein